MAAHLQEGGFCVQYRGVSELVSKQVILCSSIVDVTPIFAFSV